MMPVSRWRVVAVRRNGRTVVLDEYLPRERADAFQKAIRAINAFPDVRVEPDIEEDVPLGVVLAGSERLGSAQYYLA